MPTSPYGAPASGSPRDDDEDEPMEAGQDVQGDQRMDAEPVQPVVPIRLTRAYSRPAPTIEPSREQFGTTGGIIPQQAGTWDPKPMARERLSDDPAQREQQSMARAEADFEAKQRAANPFLFSGAVKKLADVGGRRYMDRAVAVGERDYEDQLRGDRAAIVDRRRAEVEQQRAQNEQRIQQMTGTGQKFRRDEFGNVQPVMDAQGRSLFKPTKWQKSVHPKTGRPVFEMRDQFQQRQYKTPQLMDSPDPLDDNLYADFKEDGQEPYMTKAEAAASPDLRLRTMGLAALKKQRTAQATERLSGYRQAADAAQLEIETGRATEAALRQRAEAVAATNPEEYTKLLEEADAIDARVKDGGELSLQRMVAGIDLRLETAALKRDASLIQRDELASNLIERGIDPKTSNLYIQNEARIAEAEKDLEAATRQRGTLSGLMKPVPQAAATVAPPAPVSRVRESGKSFARGASAEGIYAASEGLARAIEGSERAARGRPAETGPVLSTGQALARGGKLPQFVGEGAKWYADATKTVRENIRRALPVDEKFAQSFLGKVTQGAGQLGATALTAVPTGGTGIAATSFGQVYDEGYQDAKAAGASDADAHDAAVKYLPAAALDTLADRMVIGKILKPLMGKMTVGQLAKDILKTGLVEGATEGVQQAYLNAVAKALAGYDPNRPFDQDVLDSFLVGMVLGGGASGVGQGTRMATQGRDGAPPEGETAPVEPGPETPFGESPEGAAPVGGDSELESMFTGEEAADTGITPEPSVSQAVADESEVAEFNRNLDAIPGGPRDRQAELEEAFGAVVPNRVNPVSAVESAEVFEAAAREENAKEERIQSLVDQISGGNDAERSRILAFRKNLGTDNFLAALEGVVGSPRVRPSEVAEGVQAEVERIAQGPINSDTPGVENVGRIPPAELDVMSDVGADVLAERAAAGFAGATPEEVAARRAGQAMMGPETLSNENQVPQPSPDEPVGAAPEVPESQPQQPAPDVPASEELVTARGRPPVVEQSPEAVAKDRRQYDVLQRRMSALLKARGADAVGSQEYQSAWKASEDIKNRHGGMPPGDISAESQPSTPTPNAPNQPNPETPAVVEAPVATPSQEQRLNDAGANLPPISGMSREAKRAELDAAGITTYNGKPLDEANPAQISAAVGKLRRGELTPEGEPAKERTSDRVIKALEKAKIRKPGELSAATEPFSIAYDAALDLAIVSIRAGRAVADAIKLAVARFKAMHKDATDADVARLTAAIQSASEPPPAPGTDKSKVPESLRDRGVPAEDIEYDVRNQDKVMDTAREALTKFGPERAEKQLSNRRLPADARVALGGLLLSQKMAEMKTATGANAAKLTKDINRITAAIRSGVSTESGQGVAMHNKIYENIGVRASSEYANQVQNDRVKEFGGERAVKAAQEVADAFNATKDQKARDAAIERLKKRYTEKPVTKMLNALKGLEKAMELNELGVLTRDDMIDVAGKALGLPGVSADKLRNIARLSEKITNAKSLAEAEEAQLELTEAIAKYKGTNVIDLVSSMTTLNVLLAPNTQVANAGGNTFRLMSELASVAAVNPTKARQAAIWDGFKDGLPTGWDQAKSIWTTGRGTRDLQDKTIGVTSDVERADFKELLPNWPESVTTAMNMSKKLMARVGRFMRAVDAMAYYPAREAYARLVATKYFEGDLKGPALEKKVAEVLHTNPADLRKAREQAKSEGYDGISVARRASEIIEAKRQMTDIGAEAVAQSEKFAAETTYTNEPEGNAGVVYRAAVDAVGGVRWKGVPILKPWMMFLRTPTNMFNATLNWTPAGFERAISGSIKDEKSTRGRESRRQYTEEERNRMFFQASVGSGLMAGTFVAVMKGLMDVTFKGPDDKERRDQLTAAGWRPYSVRVGDGPYLSYRDTPALLPLAIVGYVSDATKYGKGDEKEMFMESRIADALLAAPVESFFASSPLTGLADLLGAATGKGKGLGRGVTSLPSNVLIPGVRTWSEIDRYLDPKVYDSNPLQQTVPFARRAGTERTDIQGRPVETVPADRFFGATSDDPLDRLIADRKLFIPGVGTNIKLGDVDMTDEQRDEYKRISGQRIRLRLLPLVPVLQKMPLEKAQDRIAEITKDERAKAKSIVRRSALTSVVKK
jgi:hypothetical protein